MSIPVPPPRPEDDPELSGRLTRLKPWHYAGIVGIVAAVALLSPAMIALFHHQQQKRVSDADLMAGGLGTAWTPPVIQVVAKPGPIALPPIQDKPLPMPAQGIVPTIGAKDPDAAAIASPIRMAGSHGGDVGAARTGPTLEAGQQQAAAGGELGERLKPTELTGYKASRLKDPEWTIEQGRIIACTDVTAIDSNLPGFVKASLPNDVWSADGSHILLNRGSTVFGEIAHGLTNGQERLFVLWRQVTTPKPDFVRITLNSPAADELGEAGLDGDVNHHTWKKIGGALMLSGVNLLMQGASSGLSNLIGGHGGAGSSNLNFYSIQGSGESLASQLLASTLTIPDVLHRNQATPCSIFTSGDLSFAGVYRDRIVR